VLGRGWLGGGGGLLFFLCRGGEASPKEGGECRTQESTTRGPPETGSPLVFHASPPLVKKSLAGRMVRAMNLLMAIHTSPVVGDDVEAARGLMAPQHVHVARLAKLGGSGFHQAQVVRPMGHVAVQAVLPHGRVLPEHRGAALGVAGVALRIARHADEQPLPLGSVRVVAGGAAHLLVLLISPEKMGRPLVVRLSDIDVAAGAELPLGRL